MTTQQTKVDWSRPIEAVHEDGRVVAAAVSGGPDCDDDYTVNFDSNGGMWVHADGRVLASNWRIRNVAQPKAPIPDHFRDAANMIPTPSPELTGRMVAFVREVAASPQHLEGPWAREARAIMAELEPVDGDLIEAREIVVETGHDGDWASIWVDDVRAGKHDTCQAIRTALAAIKRGRALAEAGK